MDHRLILAAAALVCGSTPAPAQQTATYFFVFTSPASGGGNGTSTIYVSPGAPVTAKIMVYFNPGIGATASQGTLSGTVLGLSRGGFSIHAEDQTPAFPQWTQTALQWPYNFPSGTSAGTPACHDHTGVVWDTGPLTGSTHPLPENGALVWKGLWDPWLNNTTFWFTDLAPTRVWVLPPGGSVPFEATFDSLPGIGGQIWANITGFPVCYANCDGSLLSPNPPYYPTLTIADFGCFQTKFVAGDPYTDCNRDCQLTIADFGCFQTKFIAGCP